MTERDYLPPELRAFVDSLAKEVTRSYPTDKWSSARTYSPQLLERDMHGMPPQEFETFCFHLLDERGEHLGCNRAAGSGQAQDGLDIYVWERSNDLVSYQVKHRTGLFRKTDLKTALQNFERGSALAVSAKFVVITSTQLDAAAHAFLQSEKSRFVQRTGVELEIWDSHHLWYSLMKSPVTAGFYLDDYAVKNLCGSYYQHARRIIRIQEEERVRSEMKQEIASVSRDSWHSHDPDKPRIENNGNKFVWRNNILHLACYLPTTKNPLGSCGLSLLSPQHEKALFSFSHEDILRLFWPKHGVSGEFAERRFFSGTVPGEEGKYFLELPNAKVFVSAEIASCLRDAVDALIPQYLEALRKIERAWDCRNFKQVISPHGHEGVILGTVSQATWRSMIDFSHDYDHENGNSEWHMFDYASRTLKPYHETETKKYDRGWHAFLHARPSEALLVMEIATSDVDVVWKPPRDWFDEDKISDRGYWGCQAAFDWLKQDLFPEIHKWRGHQMPLISRLSKFVSLQGRQPRPELKITNYIEDHLIDHDMSSEEELLEVVEMLQVAFHEEYHDDPFKFEDHEYKSLLEMLSNIIKRANPSIEPHIGYIVSKLPIDSVDTPHELLIALGQEISREDERPIDSGTIELIFRAIGAALDHAIENLGREERKEIRAALAPFIERVQEKRLVEKFKAA